MLIYICHFLHHKTFLSIHSFSLVFFVLSRYSCLHLGSLHPRIYIILKCFWKKKYLLDAVESTEVDNLLLEVSETLKLSVDAKGANNLCLLEMLVFVAASASSFDLTFSKMLLKRPRLTSAVVSLRDFLG